MVDDSERFSALPHEIIRDTRLSRDARLLYAVLQMYWWQGGECWETHATLAADLGCGVRQLQRYLDELIGAGLVAERRRGHGQQKAYAPVLTRQGSRVEHDTGDAFNTTPVSPRHDSADVLAPNTTPVTGQHDTGDAFNTTPVSDRGRHPEEDVSGEKTPGEGVAADAAPAPAAGKPARRGKAAKAAGTRAPDSIELSPRHLAYAAEYGYADPSRVREITDAFLAHHRFKGTVGRDWYAGWQGWIRRQREIDDDRAARRSAPPSPNGRAVKNGERQPAAKAPVRMKVY